MNANLTVNPTQSVESTNPRQAVPVTSRPGRGLRRLFAALIVAVLGLVGSFGAASPASAATSMATVRVCFDDQTHYSRAGMPWTKKASYILYNPSTRRWQTQTSYASPTGCTLFSVYPGYSTYFEAYENWSSYYYAGQSRVYTFQAGRYYDLGWIKVTKTLTF